MLSSLICKKTHTYTAHGDDCKGPEDSCCTNDPGETQKKNHAQDVLHAGQINSNEGSHLWDLRMSKHTHMFTDQNKPFQ